MSLKVKLISAISLFMLMLGVLVICVFAATFRQLAVTGSVSFEVADKSLYVKDVRIRQDMSSEPTSISGFEPCYMNGDFNLDLTGVVTANTYGSFSLYFDIINATDTQWEIRNVNIPAALSSAGVTDSYSGIIYVNDLEDTDGDGFKNFDPKTTNKDGTLVLTIVVPNSTSINLDGIIITIDEYIDAALYVTSVSSSGATPDTYSNLRGKVAIDGSIDLSGITFNTGETTLTISMTSLNENYLKNIVSWYDTPNITISSTSLYLPQNPSEQLTSGTSRNLTITVNNTGSATTISGLEVEFEEKTDLLQVTEEDETSTYTEEGYWYVEMGTYSTTSDNAEGKRESEYLRWRYFSDTTSHYKFDRNKRPTGEGYFILENYYSSYASTNVGGLYCSWNNDYKSSSPYKHQLNGWTNIDANDYSTSTIRQYMNSEEERVKRYYTDLNSIYSPNDPASNMFIDLHIDPGNDIIYTGIIGRTLGDLYTDMTNSTTNLQDVKMPKGSSSGWEGAKITYSEDDADKFWLLSYYEAYTLLSGNATPSSDTDKEWGDFYWLRSPGSSGSNLAYFVSMLGSLNSNRVYNDDCAVRAAFKLLI